MAGRRFIKGAVKHPGSLTQWAKQHHFIRGNRINLSKALRYAKRHHLTHRIRQINLAKTLRGLRKR